LVPPSATSCVGGLPPGMLERDGSLLLGLVPNDFPAENPMTAPLLSHDPDSTTWTDATPRRQPAREPRLPVWFWVVIGLALLCGGVGLAAALMPPAAEPTPAQPPAEIKRKEIVKNVFLETQGDVRRVVVVTQIVRREGQLEGLLTRTGKKEHEYILA